MPWRDDFRAWLVNPAVARQKVLLAAEENVDYRRVRDQRSRRRRVRVGPDFEQVGAQERQRSATKEKAESPQPVAGVFRS